MDDDSNNLTPVENSDQTTEQNAPVDQADVETTPIPSEVEGEDQTEEAPAPPIEQAPPQAAQIETPQSSAPAANSFLKNLLLKAQEKIQFNKKKKLEKIMQLAKQKGDIANSDVEKLLRVSHPTASRYLSQLVKENKLKVSGRSVDSKYELF